MILPHSSWRVSPCIAELQIMEKTVSKTGKHGSTRCGITGTDILNGNKIIESMPSSFAMVSFAPRKTSFEAMDFDEKNDTLKLLDSDNNEVDFPIREISDPNGNLTKIREGLDNGAIVTVFLLCAPVEDNSEEGFRMDTIIDEIKVENA